jgi:uncharacterized protein
MEVSQFDTGILSDIYAEIERRFISLDDPAHGWEHVDRVYKLALQIAEQEGADRFIVGMAALMHDLGRTAGQHTAGHHADISVTLASELLASHTLPAHMQEAILHAIAAHSYSRGVEPLTLEARVVRDADRLDALGAIGILRWAITGAVRRTSQTRSYHPTDPFAKKHTPDDHTYMLDHFFAKLLKLSETMTTQTGRALAEQRTTFMYSYLDELKKELPA